MEIDAKPSKKLANSRAARRHLRPKIDASPEQLISLFFRVSLSSSEDSVIMSRSFIFPELLSANALPANLFDVSSRSSTGADGKAVFLLSDFICSTINSFAEPVNVVVTPNATTPCYATMTQCWCRTERFRAFNDFQITVFTWSQTEPPHRTSVLTGGADCCRFRSFSEAHVGRTSSARVYLGSLGLSADSRLIGRYRQRISYRSVAALPGFIPPCLPTKAPRPPSGGGLAARDQTRRLPPAGAPPTSFFTFGLDVTKSRHHRSPTTNPR